ncbi:hypothetical protein RQM47_02855 [Rubrivirga sp. S365]|nr:hypothetical protein [Rubrivirga sp. S365]MDT7855572.1 hypothetical protein [Rubrivirga sp. S365]
MTVLFAASALGPLAVLGLELSGRLLLRDLLQHALDGVAEAVVGRGGGLVR